MAPEFLLRDAQLTKCQFTIATRYTDTQMFYVMAGGSETSIVMVDVGARPLAPFGWSTPTVPATPCLTRTTHREGVIINLVTPAPRLRYGAPT